MERLYTEKQWRAIERIEFWTDEDQWGIHRPLKRVVGPNFSAGEFFLFAHFESVSGDFVGPLRADGYYVREVTSNLRFCGTPDTQEEALNLTRQRIQAIGPELLQEMLAKGRAEYAVQIAEERRREQELAEREAAKRARRETRLGKRARAVFDASGGKCHYCGCTLDLLGKWHIEHKMPRALKGGSEMHNLVASCVPCNMRKRDKTDLEFQALLEAERAVQAAQSSVCDVNPRGSVGVVHAADSLARH